MYFTYENEKWKSLDFLGFTSYDVSDHGRVKSYHRNKEKILIGGLDTDGCRQIILCEQGIATTKKIYRMVALAFLPNPNNLPEVNHIDENKTNDHIDNLVWATAKDRINRGSILDRCKKTRINNAKGLNGIACYDLNGNLIKTYKSAYIAAKNLNVTTVAINQCCRGAVNTCKGYILRHYEDVTFKNIIVPEIKLSGESSKKKVVQYNLNGEFMCLWDSATTASKSLNLSLSDITSNCNGYRNTDHVGTYIFKYLEGDTPQLKIEGISSGIYNKNGKKTVKCRKVAQYTLDGELIKIWNGGVSEISDNFNITIGRLYRNCKKITESVDGYVWRFL